MGFMLKVVGADPAKFTARTSGPGRSSGSTSRRVAARSGRSPATTTPRTSPPGTSLACEAWSGDVIQLQFDNPDIKFVTPEEGLSLWSDNMMVPNGAEHQANAEKWIDYYYEPEVAAKLAAWVNYICPVEGASRRWRRSTRRWSTTS